MPPHGWASGEGDQDRPPQNLPLWHTDYSELKAVEKPPRQDLSLKKKIIYDCAGSSLLHAGALVVVSGLLSEVASLAVQHGLWDVPVQELRPWAELPCGMWNPPGPGTEPMSPALACGLPTTGPPGKPKTRPFWNPHWCPKASPVQGWEEGTLSPEAENSTGRSLPKQT